MSLVDSVAQSNQNATNISGLKTRLANALTAIGVGGSPGGLNKQIQFNDAGNFNGDVGLIYDKATGILTVAEIDSTATTVIIIKGGTASVRLTSGFIDLKPDGSEIDFRIKPQASTPDGATCAYVVKNVGGVFTLENITLGVADSGGVGFKLLRVPN